MQQLAISMDLPASDDEDDTFGEEALDELPTLAWVRIQECGLDSLNGAFAIVLPPGYRDARVMEASLWLW